MTDDDSVVDRLRAVADDLRESVGADRSEPEEDRPVAPLERTLVEKQREKMDDVAGDLDEE